MYSCGFKGGIYAALVFLLQPLRFVSVQTVIHMKGGFYSWSHCIKSAVGLSSFFTLHFAPHIWGQSVFFFFTQIQSKRTDSIPFQYPPIKRLLSAVLLNPLSLSVTLSDVYPGKRLYFNPPLHVLKQHLHCRAGLCNARALLLLLCVFQLCAFDSYSPRH